MNELTHINQQVMQSQSIDEVERLMILRREIEANDARTAYQRDFIQLQSKLPAIVKSSKASFSTKKGGQATYSFAKIDELTSALKPYMIEHGFSFMFKQREIHGSVYVSCIVMHVQGHRESSDMSGPVDLTGSKNHMQAVASTVSYLRRLTFTSAFGLSVVDESKAPPLKKYYAESAFKTNFPVWKMRIDSGKKTPQQVLSLLSQKGIHLTEAQKQQVLSCGVSR